MPHSIAEAKSSQGAIKDEPMDEPNLPSSIGQAAGDDDVDMDDDTKSAPPAKRTVGLTDLFAADDSDDEEFPSSALVKEQPSSPPARIPSPT